jgi:hypothetical protein
MCNLSQTGLHSHWRQAHGHGDVRGGRSDMRCTNRIGCVRRRASLGARPVELSRRVGRDSSSPLAPVDRARWRNETSFGVSARASLQRRPSISLALPGLTACRRTLLTTSPSWNGHLAIVYLVRAVMMNMRVIRVFVDAAVTVDKSFLKFMIYLRSAPGQVLIEGCHALM